MRDLKAIAARAWSSPARRSRRRSTPWRTLINHALGNVGKTVEFLPRSTPGPADQVGSLRELVARHRGRRGRHADDPGGQPGLRRPGRPRLRRRARERQDQAADPPGPVRRRDRAALPLAHPRGPRLEAWSDVRAFDGTATIQQPLIAPLYERQVGASKLLAVLLGEPDRSGLEIVRDYWKRQALPGDFEAAWQQALRRRASSPARRSTAEAGRAQASRTSPARRSRRRRRRGPGARLPARPDDLGRPVRQQRLAPGAAQAADQADLGQRGADQPGAGRAARGRRTRTWSSSRYRGRTRADPGLDHAGPGRRLGHGPPGLRPHAGRPGRQRGRRRRLCAADLGRTLVRRRARGRQDGRDAQPPGGHAAPPSAWRDATSIRVADARRVPARPRLRPGARPRAGTRASLYRRSGPAGATTRRTATPGAWRST